MALSCAGLALRLLTSILLFLSITHAIALPKERHSYEILDPRSPSTQNQDNEPLAIAGSQIEHSDDEDPHNVAVTLNNKKEPSNFFKDLGDFLSQYDIGDFIRYVFGEGRKGGGTPDDVKTVVITPTIFMPLGPSPARSTITSRRTLRKTQTLTRTWPIAIPSFPTTRAGIATPISQNAVQTAEATAKPASEISAITTSIPTPEVSILPIVISGEHLSDNVTWPSLTVISGTVEFPLPTQTEIVISYWPLPEPTSSPWNMPLTGSVRELPVATILPIRTDTNPATRTAGPLSILSAPEPTGTTMIVFPSYEWNATLVPSATRPFILTNPLRPTKETWTNTTAEEETSTTTINATSTRYSTLTVFPTPASVSRTGFEGTISPVSLPPEEAPLYANTTYFPQSAATSFATNTPAAAQTSMITSILPIIMALPTSLPLTPTNGTNTTTDYATKALSRLRQICKDPEIKTITLPLVNKFYGPNAYPSLNPFPGCIPPNPSQALRAPGLLNCTLLGSEVQKCQQNGRRVLISVKADSPSAVDGNKNYGRPAGPSGVRLPFPLATNGLPLQPLWPNTNWTFARAGGAQPNLFDATHHPTSLALTLFSLFGEGHTERADLRPLGPDPTNTTASPIVWLSRPLGEEVVIDGYDVRVPSGWKGTFQDGEFKRFVARLRELNSDAWLESGGEKGAVGDLGADGKGIVVFGWS